MAKTREIPSSGAGADPSRFWVDPRQLSLGRDSPDIITRKESKLGLEINADDAPDE